ncbi:MAG: helix-turn-helix transcriptional regulator [Catenulispora sp.]|nr:helix-turn-helix transcriptional regulator [Catenulispora sp.]
MGELRFGVHDAVNVRFAVSPLWETMASLRAVADPGGHVVHLPWIRKARSVRQEDRRLAAATAPLYALITQAGGAAALLAPPPRCPLAELDEELALLLRTPLERVRAAGLGDRPDPAPFARRLAEDPEGALGELADAIDAWWQATLKPHWARIRALLEADIAHRARQLAEDGVQEVFAGLHPAIRWEDDRLVSPDLPAAGLDLGGTGIVLTPSVFAGRRWHLLGARPDAAPAAVYPSRAVGTLWECREPAGEDSLARLLGRSRAQLLAYTDSPATTTQLAARSGLSLGAVSQHLAVLRNAGLVTSHRYRRVVNYTTSELGAALLRNGSGS